MIKSYQQIKREKTKKESRLQKVRRFFRVSRFNLDEKVSEWKLRRMRKQALRVEDSHEIQGLTLTERFSRLNLEFKGFMKGWKGKVMLKKAFAMVTILAVIITAYFQNTPYASAATFTP